MRSRVTTRLVSLAALLPLLLVAVAGFGYDRFRCAFTGEITEAGCCPAQDEADGPTVDAASCCDHERVEIVHAPAEAAGSHSVALEAPAALPRAPLELPQDLRSKCAPRTEILRPPFPPPLERKQSLLI